MFLMSEVPLYHTNPADATPGLEAGLSFGKARPTGGGRFEFLLLLLYYSQT